MEIIPIPVSYKGKDGETLGKADSLDSKANTDGVRYITPQRLMNKYEQDKKNMDYIADRIANKEPLKEWVAFYWMAVAIGHILEWMERNNGRT